MALRDSKIQRTLQNEKKLQILFSEPKMSVVELRKKRCMGNVGSVEEIKTHNSAVEKTERKRTFQGLHSKCEDI